MSVQSLSSTRLSGSSGGLAQVGVGGARVGLGIGGVSGSGLGLGAGSGLGLGAGSGLGLGAGSGLGLGAGSGLGLGLGAGSGLGLGAGSGLGLGLGAGSGLGLGLGAGSGLGLGLGAGSGLGFGLRSGYGAGFGLGAGAGALVPSPAFTMGRTVAAGGLSAALATGPALGPFVGPVLSREAEKITLSTLNDRFSVYKDKIRALQQENAMLEAKLSQLTGGADMSPEAPSTSTVEFENQLSEYRNTLQTLMLDTIKLEIELDNVRGTAHELKAKFDFEQGVKFQLESDIGAMKKDIEAASDLRIDLDAKYSSLKNELDFVSKIQEEELSALQSKLGTTTTDTSVSMIEVDTGKSFDISDALNKMRMEYEKSVQQHREEAEAYYKLKMDEIQTANVKSSEAVSSTKTEISAARKELQGLGLELQGLITQNMMLEQSLAEANALCTVGVADYQAQIASLTSAIEAAKADLHKQILAYQELLDIKLALDVEISTYRKLLEGDDFKLPEFTETSYSFSGRTLPKTSTPQESSLISTDIKYINKGKSYSSISREAGGGGGVKIKQLITETTETSAISDADTESS